MGSLRLQEEGEKESFEGEEFARLEESFSLNSSFLEGDSRGEGLSEALETSSVASLD